MHIYKKQVVIVAGRPALLSTCDCGLSGQCPRVFDQLTGQSIAYAETYLLCLELLFGRGYIVDVDPPAARQELLELLSLPHLEFIRIVAVRFPSLSKAVDTYNDRYPNLEPTTSVFVH